MDAAQRSIILQHGPVGVWRSSAGSADALFADDVRFEPDGTGLVTSRSLLRGTEETPFHWAMAEPGRIRLRFVPDGTEDEPDYWTSVPIEIRRQDNDLGAVDVIAEVGRDGFWWMAGPLRWLGPVGEVNGTPSPRPAAAGR